MASRNSGAAPVLDPSYHRLSISGTSEYGVSLGAPRWVRFGPPLALRGDNRFLQHKW
jgi:hypothetical protein